MRKLLILVAVALTVAGCKSRQERLDAAVAIDHKYCTDMGLQRGTALYVQCRSNAMTHRLQEVANNDRAAADFGNRLQAAGAALQAVDRNNNVSFRCREFAGTVTCNSW